VKIFISYTSADRYWAHWIAWQLREVGHEPFVHDWEVGAGENIAGWMEDRFRQADCLIGVFSDAYCTAAFSQSERWSAFWQDPRGRSGFLVPIEVHAVAEWPGFVSPLKRLSLAGLDESEAAKRLIKFLERPAAPIDKPIFPGSDAAAKANTPPFAEGSEPLSSHRPQFPSPSHDNSAGFSPTSGPSSFVHTDTALRCIDDYEPKPLIFGRDDEIETIVGAVLEGRVALVAGGPGMGKTAVATAALHDPRVEARFGRRRVFASLETASEPRAILAKLVETLGLSPTGDEVSLLRVLEANAAERPIAAILDNAETVLETNRSEAERLLKLVAQIGGLSLVVTIRGVAPPVPGAVAIDDLARLTTISARRAFAAIAGPPVESDPDLVHLLDALDGHALSICLVAAQAIGAPSLKGLRDAWDEAHAEILRRPGEEEGRLTSVRASLALSLNGRRMKSTPLARRLMALLAYLPGGLAEADVPSLLGDRGVVSKLKANDAVSCLHQLRLVERRLDRRLRILTPLRECVKIDVPLLRDDSNRLMARYLALAAKANAIGSRDWEKVRGQIESEADNLDAVCDLAVALNISSNRLEEAIDGLADFHLFSGRGGVSSLYHAEGKLRGKPASPLAATCALAFGRIARTRSDNETARARSEEALGIYRLIGNLLGQAHCIHALGAIAGARSDNEAARARYEEAQELYRRIRNVRGEAHCIHGLGNVAEARSDFETARTRHEEALGLYRRTGDLSGEANCILSLAANAHMRSDYEAARVRYDEALELYRRIGDVLGEANCIQGLGHIAAARSDQEVARGRYEEALGLYRRIGDLVGAANCIQRLGDIAAARSDHETARGRYEEALALHRRAGVVAREAETLVKRGRARQQAQDHAGARADIEAGFALYFGLADSNDRAVPGWRALQQALTCQNEAEIDKYRELARSAWLAIGRLDLIREWID
jgi:tetratricopeptide (TPR) repeat protein